MVQNGHSFTNQGEQDLQIYKPRRAGSPNFALLLEEYDFDTKWQIHVCP